MQKRYILFTLLFLMFFSCSRFAANDPDPVSVSGTVSNSEAEPIEGATVTILAPTPSESSTTDTNGRYSFSRFIDEATSYKLEVVKEGYQNRTSEFTADPSTNINFPDFQLALPGEDNSDGDSEDNDDETNESKGSAFITLEDVTEQTIQVKESGGLETSQFSFVVTDSAGTRVDGENEVYVYFDIAEGPNGGESIYPDSARTKNGVASASLTSGTAAGVVQVLASFTREEVTHITKPVSVTISGGLPNANHFEVKSDRKNQVAGGDNQANTITVLLGDKYGNTVREGTAVYLTTNKGTIDGDRVTDQNGMVTADLRSVNASPGLATVTVKTIDENSSTIEKGVDVVFSGAPLIEVDGEIILEDFESENFTYSLSDENGYPMAEGTTISVSFSDENLDLTGDTDLTLEDYSENGDGKTEFGFKVTKPNSVDLVGNLTLSISAEGPNGSTRKTLTFGGEDIEPAEPGSIYLSSTSTNNIGVKGTMQREDAQLTFMVQDKNGKPVGRENPAEVTFSFGNQPNGGESLSPTTATTNSNGEVTTTLTSGTASGTVQVIAQVITDNGDEILSKPVAVVIHSGLPDADHLTLSSDRNNISFQETGTKIPVTFLAGDRYGNNAQEGSMIYFTTDGGFIQGSAPLDGNGEATVELTVANPFPPNGLATLTATTADDQEIEISQTHQVVFSDAPQISIESGSIDLDNFSSENFTYLLQDSNGNPLPEGTTTTVSIDNEDIELAGDIDVTLGDYSSTGDGKTEFGFKVSNPSNAEITGNLTLTISTDGPNGSARETVIFSVSEPEPADPGSIYLSSTSSNSIGVKGTMQKEDAQLTFVVQDKNGNPVGSENPAEVTFSFGNQPNGGESLSPETATTNSNGEVTTTLTSGTVSGTVQVIAQVTTENGDEILSKPVAVVIHSGLPSEDHLTLGSEKNNVSFQESGGKVSVTLLAGDRYGNIAQEGTMVYFTTDGGFIEGSAPLDTRGEATVELTVANPFPPNGLATITATTADDQQNEISQTRQIVFSEAPQISIETGSIDPENFVSENLTYLLQDSNGNPLPEGTTITVSIDNEDVELAGDIDVTLGDYSSGGNGRTEFGFRASNPSNEEITGNLTLTILTNGPNGTDRETVTYQGFEPEPEEPGSIYLESVSTNKIGVKGTMQREDAQLTFIVQDKNGNPVGTENPADVEFRFGSHPNGGEELFPATATTNNRGEVTTTLTSGTLAGTVQVVAEVITNNGDEILSKPVAVVIEAGLPDEDHFTLVNLDSDQRNVAFKIGTKIEYRAYVGDRHGNNAQSGTMVYFTTDGGYIEGSSPINDQGEATVTLTVADPYPPNGIATITASTGDDLQNTILAETETMFSRDPIITITPETFNLNNGEDQTFEYSVMDSNGNPMIAGTSITVTVEGEDIEVIGDVDITVNAPNSDFSNLGELTDYTFNFRDSDRDKDEDTPVQITIEVEGDNGTARKVISGRKSKVVSP